MFERIFVSAGHGEKGTRKDPGAVTDNVITPELGDIATERAINVICAREVVKVLGSRAIGIGIDEDLTLEEKILKINRICGDRQYTVRDTLLIEIHVDYSGAPSGFGAYFYRGSSTSAAFGQKIIDTMAEKLPPRKALWLRPDSFSNYGSLGIVKNTIPLAALIEIGGVKVDLSTLYGDAVLDEAAAIAEGIRAYAGWPTPVPIEPDPDIKQAMGLISSAWKDIANAAALNASAQVKMNQANTILRNP